MARCVQKSGDLRWHDDHIGPSCFPVLFPVASQAGHQAQAYSSVGPCQKRGSSSHRAMDACQSLQRQRLCLEPWIASEWGGGGIKGCVVNSAARHCCISIIESSSRLSHSPDIILFHNHRRWWRRLKCVTCQWELQSLSQGRTGSLQERWVCSPQCRPFQIFIVLLAGLALLCLIWVSVNPFRAVSSRTTCRFVFSTTTR